MCCRMVCVDLHARLLSYAHRYHLQTALVIIQIASVYSTFLFTRSVSFPFRLYVNQWFPTLFEIYLFMHTSLSTRSYKSDKFPKLLKLTC